ncbi:hypothetical protein [Sagittula sp. S175]|uniref:hypothetical protein n=1 Tax=Sagittula sp. S175 TaxID=3415129 RepID=UPI003C7AED4A
MSDDLPAPGRSHPLRSAVIAPTWGEQAIAIVLSLVATVVIGRLLSLLGNPEGSGLRMMLSLLGILMTFSVMFSWIGHLAGALVLQALFARGWAGWAVVALAGLLVGAVLAQVLGGLGIVMAPMLALLQLVALRLVVANRSRASG